MRNLRCLRLDDNLLTGTLSHIPICCSILLNSMQSRYRCCWPTPHWLQLLPRIQISVPGLALSPLDDSMVGCRRCSYVAASSASPHHSRPLLQQAHRWLLPSVERAYVQLMRCQQRYYIFVVGLFHQTWSAVAFNCWVCSCRAHPGDYWPAHRPALFSSRGQRHYGYECWYGTHSTHTHARTVVFDTKEIASIFAWNHCVACVDWLWESFSSRSWFSCVCVGKRRRNSQFVKANYRLKCLLSSRRCVPLAAASSSPSKAFRRGFAYRRTWATLSWWTWSRGRASWGWTCPACRSQVINCTVVLPLPCLFRMSYSSVTVWQVTPRSQFVCDESVISHYLYMSSKSAVLCSISRYRIMSSQVGVHWLTNRCPS